MKLEQYPKENPKQEARLAERENRIEKHLSIMDGCAFEIGKELAAIHNENDFPEETFEAYVKRRWNRKRNWAYKLMDGFKIRMELPNDVSEKIQNTSQALAFKSAPKGQEVQVWQAASKDGAPTEKSIREAVKQLTNGEQSNGTAQVDRSGNPIPKDIQSSWSEARRAGLTILSSIKRIESVLGTADANFFAELPEGYSDHMKPLRDSFECVVPYAVCPRCKGAKCETCGSRGFVSKDLYKNSPDEEFRKARDTRKFEANKKRLESRGICTDGMTPREINQAVRGELQKINSKKNGAPSSRECRIVRERGMHPNPESLSWAEVHSMVAKIAKREGWKKK